MTSRGDNEEKIYAIANAIHTEEHITDLMEKHPEKAKELAEILDRVRKNRQELVKLWAKGNYDENYWCPTKHLISLEYHLRELLANASRIDKERTKDIAKILNEVVKQRKEIASKFLSSSQKSDDETCERCLDDLNPELANKIEQITKNLNMRSDNDFIYTYSDNKEIKGGENKNMITLTDVGLINAGQFAGKAAIIGAEKVDKYYEEQGKDISQVSKRPSTYINTLGGLAIQLGAFFGLKKYPKIQLPLVILGSHMLTKVLDYAKEASEQEQQATAGLRARPTLRVGAPTLRVSPVSRPAVKVSAPAPSQTVRVD